jgi:hypothetical protein
MEIEMIWSPYAIRRAVYAYNKHSNRTIFDRMVSALNEAARIHGLKGSDEQLVNELNQQIILYQQELDKVELACQEKINQVKDEFEEELSKVKKRELERIKYEANKIKQLKRERSIAVSLLSQVQNLVNNGFTIKDIRSKGTVFARLSRLVGSDVRSALSSIKIEEGDAIHEN